MRRPLSIGAGVVVVAIAAHGCRAPTQVTLDLSLARVTCGALQGEVKIIVAGDTGESERRADGDALTTTVRCASPEARELGTLVVTPGASGRAAVVVVVGIRKDARTCKPSNDYDGCVVARRSLAFREHVSATVPIVIEPECVDIPCSATSTCAKGTCITSELDCDDDGNCVSSDERGRDNDGGAPIDGAADGAPADAGQDGATDAPPDGEGGAPPGVCSTCVDPNSASIVNCAGGTGCCQHASKTVAPTLACEDPSACRATGIQLCCQGKKDCPVPGEVCCFKAADAQMEPHGTASCLPAAACTGPTINVILCTTPPDCEFLDCNPWLPFGHTTNLMGCLP